jgi:hypothetical protein
MCLIPQLSYFLFFIFFAPEYNIVQQCSVTHVCHTSDIYHTCHKYHYHVSLDIKYVIGGILRTVDAKSGQNSTAHISGLAWPI